MKIEIEHVSKKIKDALVLDDVCMTLKVVIYMDFRA